MATPREVAQSYARNELGLNLGNMFGFGQDVLGESTGADSVVKALERVFAIRVSNSNDKGLAAAVDITDALRKAGINPANVKGSSVKDLLNAIRSVETQTTAKFVENNRIATREKDLANLGKPPTPGEQMGPPLPAGGVPQPVDSTAAQAAMVSKVANVLQAIAPGAARIVNGRPGYEAWALNQIYTKNWNGSTFAHAPDVDDAGRAIDLSMFRTGAPAVGDGGGGGGGGGFAPQQTSYQFASYPVAGRGNVLYKIASDGSNPVEVPGITLQNPLTNIGVEETTGDLTGFNPVTQKNELIKKGYSFPKSDPNVKIVLDKTTGKTIAQNIATGEKRELGTYDFPEISPQETAAEAASLARLGPAGTMRGQDISAYTTDRGQSITERGNERTAGLNEFNTVKGILNSPSDYLARAFLSQGKASPGGSITQADLINSLRAEMGPLKQVSPALDLSQFNPETYKRMADVLAPRQQPSAAPTGALDALTKQIADLQARLAAPPPGAAPTVTTQPTQATNPAAPTAPQWALDLAANPAYNGSIPTPVTGAAVPTGGGGTGGGGGGTGGIGAYAFAPPDPGDPNPLPPPPSSYDTGDMGGVREDYVYQPPPAAGYDEGDMGGVRTDAGYGDGMAYGGATRDPRFIVGDRHDGRPTGNEEMIINPTRAPIQVVPNSRLAAYYGGTMPDRFADGTESRFGAYPRYESGSENRRGTADDPNRFNFTDFLTNPLIKADPTGSAGLDTALGIASDLTSPLSIALALLPGGLLVKGARGAALAAKGAQAARAATAAKAAATAAETAKAAFISKVTGNLGNQAQRLLPQTSSFTSPVINAGGMTSREGLRANLSNFARTPGFSNRLPEVLNQAQQSGGLVNPQTRSQIENLFRQNGEELTDDMWNAITRIRETLPQTSRLNRPRFPMPTSAIEETGAATMMPTRYVGSLASSDPTVEEMKYLLTRSNPGFAGYAEGTDSRLGDYPRYADGVLPVVQGAPAGSLAPITQDEIVNMARQYSPPVVNAVLGQGTAIPRQLPVQSASMMQTNNLTSEDMSALGTRLAAEGTSMTDYNALQQGLFGKKRTARRGRLVI